MRQFCLRSALLVGLLVALTALAAPGVPPASAAVNQVFTVTSSLDQVDALPGNGFCSDANGECTLRAAIMEANALGGAHTINLPAAHSPYAIAFGAPEDAAVSGDYDILSDITLIGEGSATTVIDGGALERVFEIFGANVNLRKVTVQNGFLYSHGGGIRINTGAKLTLKNSVVQDNHGGLGGGIAVEPDGELVTVNVTIQGNDAQGGGGLWVYDSKATLKKTTIQDHLLLDASAINGAGISMTGADSVLKLVKSSVKNNRIIKSAAGIMGYGKVVLTQSTLSGNVATDNGGGLYMNLGTLEMTNSTISNNTAAEGAGIYFQDVIGATDARIHSSTIAVNYGGGLDIHGGSIVKMRNSILALNRIDTVSLTADDCAGALVSNNNNLIGDTTNCTITGGVGKNLYALDPLLGALQNNGGPTSTHLPAAGSPVIDKGKSSGCINVSGAVITVDQRVETRPIDGDGNGNARCDIGSVEVQ